MTESAPPVVAEPPTPSASGLSVKAVVEQGEFRLDVEFDVAPGEVLGVLGPNGAGKTTLLRALAGLTALTAGHIALDGRRFDDAANDVFLGANQRPIAIVFQNYRLFPHLSVRDNVAFAARCKGVSKHGARERAEVWLSRLDLLELAGRRPGRLSGGQAQRVALARALAAEPGLLLLDEPLAALDARTRLEVRAELRRHLAEFTGPTLLVTHDPLEAMVMTDRLLVIEGGRIVQEGTPAEVARRPETQYVARLVGLNLYAGTRNGAQIELADGGTFTAATPVPAPVPPRGSTGETVTEKVTESVLVAVRPTAIALHVDRPDRASPRNVWPGKVAGLELLVDRVRVEIDASPPALVDVTADAVAELNLAAGTAVWLSAKATDVDVYPVPNASAID
jgi:molybdate transport system ATP-binding protein